MEKLEKLLLLLYEVTDEVKVPEEMENTLDSLIYQINEYLTKE